MPNERFPLLLWGDLVKGEGPVLRRSLAGWRAHECMYAWVYLTDYLSVKRFASALSKLPAKQASEAFAGDGTRIWQHLDRKRIDPHAQIAKSAFESSAFAAAVSAVTKAATPNIVELGSTFFATKTKIDAINAAAKALIKGWKPAKPRWTGIDNSFFMHDVTETLHGPGKQNLVSDYKDLKLQKGVSIFISRFVASYVFETSAALTEFLSKHFDAMLIEDAYSTTTEDIPVQNHGQPEWFLSLPKFFGGLEAAGYEAYLLDSWPDHPAGSARCHVIRYAVLKRKLNAKAVFDAMGKLGFLENGAPERIHASTILQDLNGKVSDARWRVVDWAKARSPVWGRTPENLEIPASAKPKQVSKLRQLFAGESKPAGAWEDYHFDSEAITNEIARALGEEGRS